MTTVLITGTSSGIGLATALGLAKEGFLVYAGMRNRSAGAGLLLDAAGKAASNIEVVELDVDSDDSVIEAVRHLPELDALVNNAGVTPAGAIEEFSLAQWQATFDTNLFGAIRCAQAVLPNMRERGRGCIVNVGSFGGRTALPGIGAYIASKAALASVSEVLAIEVRPFGVRVVLLEVGYTATAAVSKAKPLDRSSTYVDTNLKGMLVLGAGFAAATEADVVAEAIRHAITVPTHPFRLAIGHQAAESIALRQSMTDEAWIDLFSGERSAFLAEYESLSGVDLTASLKR